jgi:beta-lactam-binding protein with PASTA domain/predicted Ser/Thr protein kinase
MTSLADRYELLEEVGEGGTGVVLRARDTRLERDVAIKLLRSLVSGDPDQRRRFAREARTLAALSNEHIVRVYDYVEAGEDAFLVMEFVEGSNLARATFERLPLHWSEAASYVQPVCEALAYAHAKGVIHRDLTPANILVERETGRVVTTDFGLARIARSAGSVTTAGMLVGTPEYWSPEQATGRDSDGAADMYALGCIVYLLLSGRLPFEGDDRLAVGLRRAHEDPPSLRDRVPQAPEAALALVDRLLSRDPARRPDARTAAVALGEAAWRTRPLVIPGAVSARAPDVVTAAFPAEKPTEMMAVAAPTVPDAPSPSVPRRRRRWLAPALGAAAAAAVAGVLGADRFGSHVVPAPNVVHLRAGVARARVLSAVPDASVSVVRVYSTRVALDRVIRQRPAARTNLDGGADVTLVVSKGSPFADVPAIPVGTPAAAAKASLQRRGFTGRYRFTPSWSVRKGTLIELRPGAGTRVRRPATVKIVVASGYPRAVVPDVQNIDAGSARRQLEAKHLRYTIVYRLSRTSSPNTVLAQKPRPGATVYSGTRVRLAVSRTLRWDKVFADSGSGAYESVAFTVSRKWRIRYRLDGGDGFAGVVTEFAWAREGDFFRDGSFLADTAGELSVHDVSDGPGTYRLSVRPYSSGTTWYVEVDTLQ